MLILKRTSLKSQRRILQKISLALEDPKERRLREARKRSKSMLKETRRTHLVLQLLQNSKLRKSDANKNQKRTLQKSKKNSQKSLMPAQIQGQLQRCL